MSDQERLLATIASIAAASQLTMEVADTAVDAFSKGMNFLSGAFMGDYERMTQGASGFLAATGKVAGTIQFFHQFLFQRQINIPFIHMYSYICRKIVISWGYCW